MSMNIKTIKEPEPFGSSDYEGSDAKIKIIGVSTESSYNTVWLPIETLMEEIKPVFWEKSWFDFQDK